MCRQFACKNGGGRVKNLGVRLVWLQFLMEKGAHLAKKVSREVNPSAALTHIPSAADFLKISPIFGYSRGSAAKERRLLAKTASALRPNSGAKFAAALLTAMAAGAKVAEDCTVVQSYAQQQPEERGLLMMAMLAITLLLEVGWRLRGKFDEMNQMKVKTRSI